MKRARRTKQGEHQQRRRPRWRRGPARDGAGPSCDGRIVAVSLAHAMADAVGADGQDRADLVAAALSVGAWLADVERPGRWDTLEVAEVVTRLPDGQPIERGRFLLSLAGLLGYAGLEGHLAPGHARQSLQQIVALAEDPIVRGFARRTARQLRNIAT